MKFKLVMKKIIVIFLLLNSILGCFSQTHMTFLDIPIDGKLEDFEKALWGKGYKSSSAVNTYSQSTSKSYDGKFMDYSLCTIDVMASNEDGIIHTVSVDVSKYRHYKSDIVNEYKNLYGEPKIEKVLGETYIWDLENGSIRISYSDNTDWFRVMYVDKINKEKHMAYAASNNTPDKVVERTPNEHLVFMNIPLNGTIENFHNKMIAKGLKISPFNKQAGKGVRAYDGDFAGLKSIICILYDSNSKLVHSALVSCLPMDKDKATKKCVELEFSFKEKYGEERVIQPERNIDEFLAGLIIERNVYLDEGEINLKFSVDNDTDKGYITVIYKDKKNSDRIEKSKNDAIMNDI
jgi:hypothetical protein